MSTPLREILARFGIQVDTRPLERADRQIRGTEGNLRRLITGIGGAATLVGMQRFIGSAVRAADELDKTAQQLGLTVEQLQALQLAAQLGGVDTAAFAQSLRQLQRNAHAASTGGGEAVDAFRRLGIELRDGQGNLRTGNDLLVDVARGLTNLENSTERVALAQRIFGESGARMIPMFASIANGTGDLEAELARLGGGASADMIRNAVELNDELTRFRVTTTSLRSALLAGLLPSLTAAVDWMIKYGAAIARDGRLSEMSTPLFVALGAAAAAAGVAAAIAWGSTLGPILLVAGAAAGLYLIIDDLNAAAQGRPAFITSLIDDLFEMKGLGAQVFGYLTMMTQRFESMRQTSGYLSAVWNLNFDILQRATNTVLQMTGLAETNLSIWRAVWPVLRRIQEIFAWISSAASSVTSVTRGLLGFATSGRSLVGGQETPEQTEAIRQANIQRRGLAVVPARSVVPSATTATPGTVQARGQIAAFGNRPAAVAAAPAPAPQVNVQGSNYNINVTEAQNPQETQRVVRQEIDRHEQARNREIIAHLEPAAAGTT